MSERPRQMKWTVDGRLEIKKAEAKYKVGDKVIEDPSYPHIGGVWTVKAVIFGYNCVMYHLTQKCEKTTLVSACSGKAIRPAPGVVQDWRWR